MTPDLLLVEAFLAVVETGSFRGASDQLDRSQPTISQQIARLEAEVGATLLLRRREGCVPTPEGARFLPPASRALAAARHAVAVVRGRPLVIGAASNPGIYLLPDFLAQEAAEARLCIGTNPETVARLESGELDLALLEWWDGRPGFEAILWHEEPLVAIAPPGHRWTRRKSITLGQLLAEPLLGGEAGTGMGRLLAEAGRESVARTSQRLGSTEAVKRGVAAGLGVSVVMQAAVRDEVAAGSLVALTLRDAPLRKRIYGVLPSNAHPSSRARALLRRPLAREVPRSRPSSSPGGSATASPQ